MNDFDKKLGDAKNELFSLPLIKEYFIVKSQIENNVELIELNDKLKLAQKAMSKSIDDDDLYHKNKKDYEELMIKYNLHPLIVNYQNLKEEVYTLLTQIKDILE